MTVLTQTLGDITDYFADAIEGGVAHRGVDATTLAAVIALLTDIRTQYTAHNTNNGGEYHSNTGINPVTEPVPIELGTAIALAKDLKTVLNAHMASIISAGSHYEADTTNTITATSDISTLNETVTLANALRTGYEAHRASEDPHTQGAPQ